VDPDGRRCVDGEVQVRAAGLDQIVQENLERLPRLVDRRLVHSRYRQGGDVRMRLLGCGGVEHRHLAESVHARPFG